LVQAEPVVEILGRWELVRRFAGKTGDKGRLSAKFTQAMTFWRFWDPRGVPRISKLMTYTDFNASFQNLIVNNTRHRKPGTSIFVPGFRTRFSVFFVHPVLFISMYEVIDSEIQQN